ncbi:MAG: hypothetical protein ABSH39_02045 [Candidatus Acidiferrum sp.]
MVVYVCGVVEVRVCCGWGAPRSVLATESSVSHLVEGRHLMNGKVFWLLAFFLASFFAVPTFAQCKNQQDKACWSLQYILYAAETDFLEFRGIPPVKPSDRRVTPPNPDLSVGSIHVPCHTDFWLASGVAVYICSAEVPAQEAEEWYAKTMADLQELQYLWQYKTESPGADHYVDAGPQGCEVAHVETTHYGPYHADEPYIAEGPYLGQCPLHLQTVRQDRGTVRISFWLNSSENLARNPAAQSKSLELSASVKPPEAVQPSPVSHGGTAMAPASLPAAAASATVASSATTSAPTPAPTATPAPTPASATSATKENLPAEPVVTSAEAPSSKRYSGCDDLCQGLKKVLEYRASSFRQLGARSGGSVPSKSTSPGELVKLSGASSCVIHAEPLGSTKASAGNQSVLGATFAAVSTKIAKRPSPRTPGRPATQYVCYWPQESEAAAQSEFLDLVALLRFLIPSSWLTQQSVEADERSGATLTVWSAGDSRNKSAIGLYVSGKSVGLHISSGP